MDQESIDQKRAGKSADFSSSSELEKGFHESFGSFSESNNFGGRVGETVNLGHAKDDDKVIGNYSRDSTDRADAKLEIVGSADSVNVNSEGDCSRNSHDNLEMRKVVVNDVKVEGLKEQSYVIDVKSGGGGKYGESLDGEILCRICHLSSEQLLESCPEHTMNYTYLMQLGCGCKDELGSAHSHCAEAWFKLKGNRVCEICGETAKNVAGIGDGRFIEEWNDRSADIGSSTSRNSGGCWRGQPFCNFLMACLVVAFVLPWFFRINMF